MDPRDQLSLLVCHAGNRPDLACRPSVRRRSRCSTWPGGPPCTAAAFAAVTSGEDGDSTEAAGFGDRRSHAADGAVRVCAAPRPRLQGSEFAVCAALSAAGGAAQPFTVPPAETTAVRAPPPPPQQESRERAHFLFFR